ncbi:unnamed protein product [Caenorhabditis angaria]|uniref:Acyl-coenzyme A thioesterase 13 n=1 Tax=Caenorhabditis angaria TaxID=860376 RepID=A0A9P1IBD1_9PELO|nr:unnamed protein product [Caenorhabditis angaria]
MSGKYLKMANNMIKFYSNKGQFGALLGTEKFQAIQADEGRLKVEFKVEQDMTNHFGTLHGGYTATIVDIFTTAALMCTKHEHPGVSVDLHVTYLAAAKVGETLVLDSTVTKQGRTLAFTKAEIFRKDDNRLIATAVHTKAFPPIRENFNEKK